MNSLILAFKRFRFARTFFQRSGERITSKRTPAVSHSELDGSGSFLRSRYRLLRRIRLVAVIGLAPLTICILMWSAWPRTHAANFISTQSGSWGNSNTWGGAGVPGAGDDVTISAGTTVTEDGNQACANLTVNGTLDMTNDFLFFQGTTFSH